MQRLLNPPGSAYRSETGGLMEALRVLTVEQSKCMPLLPLYSLVSRAPTSPGISPLAPIPGLKPSFVLRLLELKPILTPRCSGYSCSSATHSSSLGLLSTILATDKLGLLPHLPRHAFPRYQIMSLSS